MLINIAFSAQAWATCTSTGAPTIDMIVTQPPVDYDYSQTQEQIAALGSDVVHSTNGLVLGLTKTSFSRVVNGSFRIYNIPEGVCAVLVSLSVKIGYQPIHVYVSKQYGPGSCQRQALLLHENTHVKNATETFDKYLPGFQFALDQTAVNFAPIVAADQKSATEIALQKFNAALAQVAEKMNKERSALDAALDSPASYRATSQSCSSW